MSAEVCDHCGRDPYEYSDTGVGYARVAVNCCDEAIEDYRAEQARQALSKDTQ